MMTFLGMVLGSACYTTTDLGTQKPIRNHTNRKSQDCRRPRSQTEGVFACYVSRGHAFIDRKAWTDDARMKAAHVPEKTAFATKPALAVGMIERAIATAVPFTWVAADSVYGVASVEGTLRAARQGLSS